MDNVHGADDVALHLAAGFGLVAVVQCGPDPLVIVVTLLERRAERVGEPVVLIRK